MDVLYEHEITGRPVSELLERHQAEKAFEFASTLATGVAREAAALDDVLARYAIDWRPERMPVVDRILLRMGIYEITRMPEIPAAVTINEAVELAKTFSTEDSGKFVNGVLQKISDELRPD